MFNGCILFFMYIEVDNNVSIQSIIKLYKQINKYALFYEHI